VRIWEVNQDHQTFVLDTRHNFASNIDWDSTGSLIATSGNDACLRIWDVSRKEMMRTIDVRPASGDYFGNLAVVRWSPDDARLAAAGSDNTLRIWDRSTGEEVRRFRIPRMRPICLDWHPDGVLLAAGCTDLTVRIWDTRSGVEVAEWSAGTIVRSVAWSPDGMRLAFSAADAEGSFVAIHAAVGTGSNRKYQLEGQLRGHDRLIRAICWSPDGTRLATGSEDKTTRLWSLATWSEVLPPMRHSGSVNSIDWLGDEKHPRLVCATNAGSVSIWDPLTGKLALTLKNSKLAGPRACWSPDGRRLASASGRFLHVWDAAPRKHPRSQVPAPVE
jgi:WD40 repeat protein